MGRQVIDCDTGSLDHADRLARIDQLRHQMATDEARATRHDRQIVHVALSRFLEHKIQLTYGAVIRYSS